MKSKKSRIVLSCVSVLLVLSLMAGMTMAWFTDTEKVNANFSAGVMDINVKPGEKPVEKRDAEEVKAALTFENLRPMQFKNFELELAGNGSGKWTNDVTQDNQTELHDSDYDPVPAYFKPIDITNSGTLPTKVEISLEAITPEPNDTEPVLTSGDNATITQDASKTEDCANGLKEVMKVLLYKNENDLNNGAWRQIEGVNLNKDYSDEKAGVEVEPPKGEASEVEAPEEEAPSEDKNTYTTVVIPAGETVRYVVAGYLPETVKNPYQGKHYHGNVVLRAYQLDSSEGGTPDDKPIDQVGKSKLEDMYELAGILIDRGDSTFLPGPWAKFEAAYATAGAVLADKDATEQEIADAFYGLMDNMANLEFVTPRDILDAVIAKADAIDKDIDEDLYQEVGVAEFKEALAEAKALKPTATQTQMKKAALKLTEAMANLRLKPSANASMDSTAGIDVTDVEIALFLTQYVAERDRLGTPEMVEVFYSFLG